MNDATALQPITLHGSNIAYFTGKMENYFRVRGIPYELHSMQLLSEAKSALKSRWPVADAGVATGRWPMDDRLH
jgi:hypothetical protein